MSLLFNYSWIGRKGRDMSKLIGTQPFATHVAVGSKSGYPKTGMNGKESKECD